MKSFDAVLKVDEKNLFAEVESSCSFFNLARETLKKGLVPKIVPELRAITIGGTMSGFGVEASSFRYGLVHDSVSEFEVLTGNGDIINCSKTENSDLFYAFPNSLGSLGYITKCKVELRPAKSYVKVHATVCTSFEEFFESLRQKSEQKETNFLEGIIYSPTLAYILEGEFVDAVPTGCKIVDRYAEIYYEYIKSAGTRDYFMTTWDFLWRWDTDAFWGIKLDKTVYKFFSNRLLRKTLLKPLLRSDYILRLKKIYDNLVKILHNLGIVSIIHEELIQDAGVPIEKCLDFMTWFQKNITLYPLWICPVNNANNYGRYPLYKPREKIIVDIGFYNRKPLDSGMVRDHHNRLFEKQIQAMGAVKGLYSVNSYSEADFWSHFDKAKYFAVKQKYDVKGIFPDLYQKAIH